MKWFKWFRKKSRPVIPRGTKRVLIHIDTGEDTPYGRKFYSKEIEVDEFIKAICVPVVYLPPPKSDGEEPGGVTMYQKTLQIVEYQLPHGISRIAE